MNSNFRQRLLATTLIASVATVASPAFAQAAPPPAQPADNAANPTQPDTTGPVESTSTVPSTNAQGRPVEQSQDIVVTGSRIPQPNLTSASPVTVLSSQEIKLQGTTRTEDLINSLPQSFASQGSNISNGSTGTATVNLRGIGAARTLVLINGRRLMPGDPRSPVADINFVPDALIKRVDVLTGGASSVYGADAVGGVVNFIMDTTFTGIRVDGQASVFNHNNRLSSTSDPVKALTARNFPYPKGMVTDGGSQDMSVALGAAFDDNRGHVMGYATYRKQAAVLQSKRDYSSCSLQGRATPASTDGRLANCGGSATSAVGTFFTNVGTFQVGPNQTLIPGSTPFNFGPINYYQRPDERYTFGVFADYEVSDAIKPYMEAMFMDDKSVAQIAPSGDFFNTSTINCDNPLLSAQQHGILCSPGNLVVDPTTGLPQRFTDSSGNTYNRGVAYIGRRNVEGGGRQDDLEHTAYRIVVGSKGNIGKAWTYDASGQFGKTILAETYLNDFSVAHLTRALDVVTNPATGAPVCRSVLDGTDPNCVPYNIFVTGGVTPAALGYLQTPGFQRGDTQETVANVNFTGQLGEYGLKMPWAEDGVAVNVGAEYRKEKLTLRTDQEFSSGDLAGQGGPTKPVAGSFTVRDLFTEVRIPVIQKSFIEDLTIVGGYRFSNYHIAGNSFNTDTYKLEVQFAPVRDIRFRGTYNRAVRAPNVVELFSAQSVGLAGTNDPCAGTTPTATLAQCQLTGVSAARYGNVRPNPANQYNSFLGGNPNLNPETADTYTVGVVLQPRFIPGFALTFDGFDIRVKNLISTIGFNTIIAQCISTGDPSLCSRIHRDAQGSLFLTPNGFITDINTNVGGLRTRGVDVNGQYSRRLGGLGSLNVSLVGTYLDKFEINPVGTIKYDCVGLFGAQCGTPAPKWRHKLRVGFNFPSGIGISGQWRYFSKTKNEGLDTNPTLHQKTVFPFNQRIPAQSYFDLALSAKIGDHYNFRLGANNILDRKPPLVGSQTSSSSALNGNTFAQVYDTLGRYLFAGFSVNF